MTDRHRALQIAALEERLKDATGDEYYRLSMELDALVHEREGFVHEREGFEPAPPAVPAPPMTAPVERDPRYVDTDTGRRLVQRQPWQSDTDTEPQED
jgi:hypothetical protein